MPEALTHPTPQELAAFGVGRLGAAAAAAVAGHLETCLACRRALEGLPPDSFVGKLRSARPGGPSLSPPPASTPAPAAGTTGLTAGAVAPAPPAGLPAELAGHSKFRIERELGRGGMGVVYLARHVIMDRPVAVKVIHPGVVEQPQALERFHAEVQAAARLDHPNIVRAYDAERAGALHLLVMEYVEGTSLDKVLGRKGPLPIAFACRCVQHAALGLQHAHEQGMVHRDLKPSNLIASARHRQVKVLDFGLARLASERARGRNLTQANDFVGTPEYVAPEQALDARSADIRADIYSLGCTLYHLLAGRPPFYGDAAARLLLAHLEKEPLPLCQVRPDVPERLSLAVGKMLAKDPARRYQTPAEVVRALRPFADADAQGGPRAKTPVPSREASPGGAVGEAGETQFPPGVPQPHYVEEAPVLPPPVRRATRGMWEEPLPAPCSEQGAQEALPDEPPRWSDTGTGRRIWLPGVVAAGVSLAVVGGLGLILFLHAPQATQQGAKKAIKDGELLKTNTDPTVGGGGSPSSERVPPKGPDGKPSEAAPSPGRDKVEGKKPGLKEGAREGQPDKGDSKPGPARPGPDKEPLAARQKRVLRWSLHFDTANGAEYLRQLQGLGAILAIPIKELPAPEYRIVRDLTPGRRAELLNEDFAKIQRISWTDDNPRSVLGVMNALGHPELKPKRFVAFMAEELEKKLFDMEKDYVVKVLKERYEEDRIAETHFKVINAGGSYQPEITDVKLKPPLPPDKHMLRWRMDFNRANGAVYLRQLADLGATLAVPLVKNPKLEDYRVPHGRRGRIKLEAEDIAKSRRVYWIEDDPKAVQGVMQTLHALGGPLLEPSHFVIFAPEKLEKRLFDMEKAYMEKELKVPYDKDRIAETRFLIINVGGVYRPKIGKMPLKDRR